MLVGLLTIAGVLDPGVQLLVGDVLFLVGAILGLVPGCLLSFMGRPRCLSKGTALGQLFLAVVLSIPLLCIGWVITAAIGLTAALRYQMHVSWIVFTAGGWALGVAVCVWAAMEARRALRSAVVRWRETRVRPGLHLLPQNHLQPHIGGGEAGS